MQCPNGLSQRTDDGLRTCVRNVSAAGCSSIFLPTRNVNYSRVCGRITGYQIGTTDGLHGPNINISDLYVDGVSFTHGLNLRQHIWTFESAYTIQQLTSVETLDQYNLLWGITISVILVISTIQMHLYSTLILCEMTTVTVVPTLHGFTDNCHSSPLMTLR